MVRFEMYVGRDANAWYVLGNGSANGVDRAPGPGGVCFAVSALGALAAAAGVALGAGAGTGGVDFDGCAQPATTDQASDRASRRIFCGMNGVGGGCVGV